MPRSSRVPSNRTTRGVEVDLSLIGVARGRWGEHVVGSLREAIVIGRLAPESSLPSTRRLSTDLGVSRGIVVDAYAQLVAEGYLISTNGGTRVVPHVSASTPNAVLPRPPKRAANPGRPDPALFPRREWARAEAQTLREIPDRDLSYGDPQGLFTLRSTLADYLGRVRSIRVDPDQIVVVNGFAQGLALLTRHLATQQPTPLVAVEDPGSTGTVDQLRAWGAEIVPVPVDADGLDIAALERSDATAVVVTPAHQYPSGVTLAPQRRIALVDWARRRDGLIIEDNYDAEYRYDRAPLTSLHALDPQRVIAAGSASKCLSPALRLGWLAVPSSIADSLAEAKAMMDLGAPTLPQATLARFISGGHLDRHIRRTRSVYRQRRDALIDALGGRFDIAGIAAGLHVLIRLDPDLVTDQDEQTIAAAARAAGLEAQPLSLYRHRPGPPGLVLGYGTRTPDHLRRAVATFVTS